MANKDYINGLILGLISSGLIKNPEPGPTPPVPTGDYHAYDTPIELYNGELIIGDSPVGVSAGVALFDYSSLKNSAKISLTLTDSEGTTTSYVDANIDHPLITIMPNVYMIGKYELYLAFVGMETSYSSNFPFVGIISEDLSDLGGPNQSGMLFVPNLVNLFPEQGTIPDGTYTLKIEALGDYETDLSLIPDANYMVTNSQVQLNGTARISNGDVVSVTGDMYNDNLIGFKATELFNEDYILIQQYNLINYNSFVDFDNVNTEEFALINAKNDVGVTLSGLKYDTATDADMLDKILFNIKKVENPSEAWLFYPGVLELTYWFSSHTRTPGVYRWVFNIDGQSFQPNVDIASLINNCSGIEIILNTTDNNPENDHIFTIMKSDLGTDTIGFNYTINGENDTFIGYDFVYLPVGGVSKQDLIEGGYATTEQLECLNNECAIIMNYIDGQCSLNIEIPDMTMDGQLFRFGLKLIF